MARLAALATVVAVAGLVAVCSGCGSSTPSLLTASPAPSTTSPECPAALAPSGIDRAFAPIAGLDNSAICPAEVDPTLASPQTMAEFNGLAARMIEQNGIAVLRVFAGQLSSRSGDTFVGTYLSDLSAGAARRNPTQAVASESTRLRGYRVTYFNIPSDGDGYAYAEGSTVVIGYVMSGGTAAAKDAFPQLLANLG